MLIMAFNFSSTVQDDDLFEQIGEELEESGSLEYVQIINAGGKIAKTLDKNPLAFGFAISSENAEAVEFQPTDEWAQGEDIPIHPLSKAVIAAGYVARTINVAVLNVSEMEVQEKVDDRWRFIGVSYEKGQHTDAGKLYEAHKDDKESPYRQVRRYLLLFLGANGEPLHSKPVQFTAKGAFGYSFNQELQSFYKELGVAYRDARKARGMKVTGATLPKQQRAYVAVPMQLGYHIPEEADRSAFTCVVARSQPVFKPAEVGVKSQIKRRDRQVAVVGALWSDFMIPAKSPLGELIEGMTSEHAAFGEPNRGMGQQSEESIHEDRPYSGTGFFNGASLQTVGDINYVAFVTDDGEIPLAISNDHIEALDCSRVSISGIIPADGGPVAVTGWQDLDTAVKVEQSLVEAF
jgi:hypothetical protein